MPGRQTRRQGMTMTRVLSGLLLLALSLPLAAELATGKAAPNELYQNASPYLAMHGRDPVRWHLWNARTLALARKQRKLLFVSSGYFSCRWCHVMQHESYQNPQIAALLNRYYIPVKIDRELSPALDARLIDFVERSQGISGWPLNVFVTPEGYPLVGMVYVPPKNLQSILGKLNKEWQQDRVGLMKLARDAAAELHPAQVSSSDQLPKDLGAQLSNEFVKVALGQADDMQGGFGQQNKFPSVPQLDTLLQIYRRHPDPAVKHFLTLTLDQMAALGLRDQLSGGFFRYCVDPGWHVPHFEKMLYDNALLARLYLSAGREFQRKDYTRIGRQTLDFVLQHLRNADGSFGASLSALDDQGMEGGYYLWDSQQVRGLLSEPEWQVAKRIWQLDGPPDLEQAHHLRQALSLQDVARDLKLDADEVGRRLASARAKLLRARQQRHVPRDDKSLAAWNGLMLSALVEGVRETSSPDYRRAAQALHDYLFRILWDGRRLARAKDHKGQLTAGTLEDYAYVIRGVADWWRLSGDKRDRIWLQKLIDAAWTRFYGAGGWIRAQDVLLRYGEGSTLISDGALPSPSAILIEATYAFAKTTKNARYQRQALRALNVGQDAIRDNPFWYASQISALLAVRK